MINNIQYNGTINNTFMFFLSPFLKINNKTINGTDFMNNKTFMNWLNLLTNFSVNTFEWKNLPEEINEQYFEYALLFNGAAAMVRDSEYGFIGLPYTSDTSKGTIYGDPSSINLTGVNGFNKKYPTWIKGISGDLDLDMAVRCPDNPVSWPYFNYIFDATKRITEAIRTRDVAVKKLKNPFVFIGKDDSKSDIQKFLKQLENNDVAILTTKKIEIDKVLSKVDTPTDIETIHALFELQVNIKNEILEILGLNTNPAEGNDRERLLVDEINANNQTTDLNLDVRLHSRQLFCTEFNKAYGLNIGVGLRQSNAIEELQNLQAEIDKDVDKKEGDDNNGDTKKPQGQTE